MYGELLVLLLCLPLSFSIHSAFVLILYLFIFVGKRIINMIFCFVSLCGEIEFVRFEIIHKHTVSAKLNCVPLRRQWKSIFFLFEYKRQEPKIVKAIQPLRLW